MLGTSCARFGGECVDAWSGVTYRVTPVGITDSFCSITDVETFVVLAYADAIDGGVSFVSPQRLCGIEDALSEDSWDLLVQAPDGENPGPGCGTVTVEALQLDPEDVFSHTEGPFPGYHGTGCGYPPREWLHDGAGELLLGIDLQVQFAFEVVG